VIYAVDFSGSLSDILADFLLEKYASNPFDLAKVKVILPTRRACQTLKESFFEKSSDTATLLPQMIALYDMEDLTTDLPEAISDWERLFLLTKLCQAKPNLKETPKAFQVALSLAELLDLSYQYQVDFSHLAELVPTETFAQHWQETVQFLDIIHTAWPQILKGRNLIDRQDRLQRIILEKAKSIQNSDDYVIIAGLTADLPSVAELMKNIQTKGDIFLDGVDKNFILSDELPEENHPQHLIVKTLKALNIKPEQVIFKTPHTDTEEFIEQSFRSDIWQKSNLKQDCLNNIKYIMTNTAEQEALTIALLLRQCLEEKDKTASFVTTDRTLARRVIAQMKRWQIHLDDSSGLPFKHTPTGSFLLQILALAENVDDKTQLLALLKHPLFANAQMPNQMRINVKKAEKQAKKEHTDFHFPLPQSANRFFALFETDQEVDLKELLTNHLNLAEELAQTDNQSGYEILWESPFGKQLYQMLQDILNNVDIIKTISTRQYANFFNTLIGFQQARQPYGYHQRLKVLGPIEARFTHSDLCIIGGLNEQVFPPLADTGPWLNRPMRKQLGMPDAEARITSLAHDFMHVMGSKEVILTRSVKNGGAPTVPSRFLQRLQMTAQINDLQIPTFMAHLADLVDTPDEKQPIVRPCPCPKAETRPTKLSVTNVELLKRNPYAIYAKYILSLYPLDDWDKPAKNAQYGQALHETMAKVINNKTLTENEILNFFRQCLKKNLLPKSDCLFYESQFIQNILPFIIQEREALIKERIHSFTEIKGECRFDVSGKPFTLTARVDRIDLTAQHTAKVIDYKTGSPPAFSDVIKGISPQLTLEAWMILQNAFPNIKANNIDDMEYWHMSKNPNIKKYQKSKNKIDLDILLNKTELGLKKMLETYANDKTPYEVEPIGAMASKYDNYALLSRKKEWAHEDEGESDGSQ
jgi:ATP-dependent helicase/nuclease subunit B